MTVEVYTVPGGYTSSRFTATVGGAAAGVWGFTRTAQMATVAWAAGASVELSWILFGSDATTEVRITRSGGPVTSFKVYPENSGHTATIVGGVLVLQVPQNTRLHCELNEDRANVVCVFASPLKPALPVSRTTWGAAAATITSLNTGTGEFTTSASHGLVVGQRVRLSSSGSLPTPATGTLTTYDVLYVISTSASNKFILSRTSGGAALTYSAAGSGNSVYTAQWTSTSNALYFPAGTHTIGKLFYAGPNTTIYLDAGAAVIGSFDLRGSQGVRFTGRGALFGTFATHAEAVAAPTFDEQLTYAMFLGYNGSTFSYDNSVEGLTVVAYPFYCTHEGVRSWVNVQLLSPWTYNCDGFDCSEQSVSANAGYATDCYGFVGDDAIRADSPWFNFTATNVFTVTSNAGQVLGSYWGTDLSTNYQRIINCHGMSLSFADGDGVPGQVTRGADSIFKIWVDLSVAEAAKGTANFVVENYHVWGPLGSRLFAIQNIPYPQAALSRDTRGDISNLSFTDVVCQQTPGQPSVLLGFDWQNTPHDISFRGLSIGGVDVRVWNWLDFFETNELPYNIFFEGLPIVNKIDLVNLALSRLGESVQVTSISPPDGSNAALLASRVWVHAVYETIGAIAWPFATRRAALVAATNDLGDTFGYCYDLPGDHVKILGVLPAGAKDDFTMSDGKPIPYQCQVSEDGVERLYTDLASAQVRYTIYVDDPNKWPPQFRNAFVYVLAAQIAGGLAKDEAGRRLSDSMMQKAYVAMQTAVAESAAKREMRPAHVPAWFARNGNYLGNLPQSLGG